FTE
ncbi:lipoprotein, putative, partial [Vibrio cholerae O1 str. EM-1546]